MSRVSAQSNHIIADSGGLDKLSFLNLPYDAHLAIVKFVNPRDLIALRKTCKAMAEVTSLRTVWVNALMRMCFENCVIPYSFSVPKMNLLELEYASMGPERWMAAIEKAHSQKLSPLPPYNSLRPSIHLSSLCQKIFLIPGGRYLFTLCQVTVAIWDILDFPTKPLATISGYCQDFTASPGSDGRGIKVCVTKCSPTSGWDLHYEIHSFTFADENPTFNKIGDLATRRDSDNYFTSISGDRLILVDGRVVKVWNFVTDEWAAWLTGIFPYQIFVSGNIVVLIERKCVFLWDIPPLQPNARALFTEAPMSTVLPRVSINYSDGQIAHFFRECTGACDWYTGTVHSLWFDLCVEKAWSGRLTLFDRYEVHIAHDDLPSSTVRPIRKHYYSIPFGSFYSPYRICGDKASMWWSKRNIIECTIGPTYEEPEDGHHKDYTITLFENMNSGLVTAQVQICPISGRLCYVCHDTSSIKIVDFLAPPPKDVTT